MRTSTALPPALLPVLRRLWSDPRLLVVLLALARAPGPLTASQIARALSASEEAVTQKLRALSAMALVTRPQIRGGWFLTRDGWGFIHNAETPRDALPESVSVGEETPENPGDALPEGAWAGEENPENPGDALPESGYAAEVNPDFARKSGFERGFCLEEESSKESLINRSSSSEGSKAESESELCMAVLLEKSPLLFGKPGVVRGCLPERPVRLVLGWLAQAYDQRRRLRAPAGLVYKRLLHGALPARVYLDDPLEFLPEEYLRAVGLRIADPFGDDEGALPPVRAHGVRPEATPPEGARAEDGARGGDRERAYSGDRADAIRPYDAPAEAAPDPSLYTILNKRTVLAGWEQALYLLRPELPAAAYQSYLAPAQPLRWEPPDRLVISLPTAYQREWVESRLKRSLERLLIGILAQGVSIDLICLAE